MSLMSQNTHSASAGRSAGTSRATRSASGKKPQVARHRILLKILNALADRFERQPKRQPGPERVAVGLHVRNHHERRPRPQFGDDFLRSSPDPRSHSESSMPPDTRAKRLDSARSPARSSDLRRTSAPAYAATSPPVPIPRAKTSQPLQRIHRLPRHMPVPNDRNEHLGILQILRDLDPHDRNKPQPRILELTSRSTPPTRR